MRQFLLAVILIAKSLQSIAHSQAIIAKNSEGISPEDAAALQQATAGLKTHTDALDTAVKSQS